MLFGINWFWYLLGSLGIGGTIALFFLGPAAVTAAVQIIAAILRWLIGSRIGCALLAAFLAFMVADIHRSREDASAFEAYKIEQHRLAKERDERIASETRADVLRELGQQALTNQKTDQEVKEFKDALPPAPTVNGVNPFLVGDAACRLRHIAGYPGCGPESSTGSLPAARSKGARPGPEHPSRLRLPRLITRGPGGAQEGQ